MSTPKNSSSIRDSITRTEPKKSQASHPQEDEMAKVTNLLNMTYNFSKPTSRFVELDSGSSSNGSRGSDFGSII